MGSSPPRLLVAAVLVILLSGCSTSGRRSFPDFFGRAGGRVAGTDEPWVVPAGAMPSQRLFRAHYQGSDGKEVGFKLILYLQNERVFHMHAADGLGRKAWDLAVDADDKAIWLDHRAKQYCEATGASRLAIVPLARMPLVALPKLLLGRLPAPPVADMLRSATALEYRDARGRKWTGSFLPDGSLDYWTRLEDGEPVTWWRRDGDESLFVDKVGQQQLRWREIVNEPLTRRPPPLVIPPRYEEGRCVD